jgi:hypothetical protein
LFLQLLDNGDDHRYCDRYRRGPAEGRANQTIRWFTCQSQRLPSATTSCADSNTHEKEIQTCCSSPCEAKNVMSESRFRSVSKFPWFQKLDGYCSWYVNTVCLRISRRPLTAQPVVGNLRLMIENFKKVGLHLFRGM